MSRPIDADKLKRAFEIGSTIDPSLEKCVCTVNAIIDEQPTITYEDLVPHGRWEPYYEDVEIYNTGGFTERRQTGWICGRCKSKKSITHYYKTDFCPSCGARMDGGKENESD